MLHARTHQEPSEVLCTTFHFLEPSDIGSLTGTDTWDYITT